MRQASERRPLARPRPNVGALPICGDEDRLHGIITDRDIVIKCIAEDADLAWVRAEDLAQGKPVFVDADTDTSEVLGLMGLHQVKRLPVVDGRRLVGMIREADLAHNLPDDQAGQFVEMLTF